MTNLSVSLRMSFMIWDRYGQLSCHRTECPNLPGVLCCCWPHSSNLQQRVAQTGGAHATNRVSAASVDFYLLPPQSVGFNFNFSWLCESSPRGWKNSSRFGIVGTWMPMCKLKLKLKHTHHMGLRTHKKNV